MAPVRDPSAALTLEEQLRAAQEIADELHDMEIRLRETIDTALYALKGESI